MKAPIVSAVETITLELQNEIRRSQEARYQHRLHAILLIAQGISTSEVAALLGDSPRTIQYWVRRFEDEGFDGLIDTERPGRPKKLDDRQLSDINKILRRPPTDLGLDCKKWDGKALSVFINRKYNVGLGIRQCQRLFRQLGFQLRKPRLIMEKTALAQKEKRKMGR